MYELTLGRDDFDPAMAARLGIAKWYTSGSNYDYDLPTANAFSALMWNNTSDLGVGIASRSGRMVLVCNYWPPGIWQKGFTYLEISCEPKSYWPSRERLRCRWTGWG